MTAHINRWWWVRHGPTHETVFTGWRDVPADLSDVGHIVRLDHFLPTGSLLVSSDLRRATATADALAKARHRLPHSAALREFNFGDWDGLDFTAIAAQDPDLSRAYWENPGDVTPPNGESWNSARARVNGFVTVMNARYSDVDIIAVAHFGVILTQVQSALGIPPSQAVSQPIDALSVTRIDWQNGAWRSREINHKC